jgi:inorganic pyrophosphatase
MAGQLPGAAMREVRSQRTLMPNLSTLPTFVETTEIFQVVVESPRGSEVKLKYDINLNVMSISRPLPSGLRFPYDWGFIPSTSGEDGDPVDALVLWDVSTYPGVVIPCRAVGVIRIEQNAGEDSKRRIRNDRILAVPRQARREANLENVDSISQRVRIEIGHFLVAATALEGKQVEILSWDGPREAISYIRKSAI